MALRENSAGPSSCQGKTDSLQSVQALLEASRPPQPPAAGEQAGQLPHLLQPQTSSVLCPLGLHLLARVTGHR